MKFLTSPLAACSALYLLAATAVWLVGGGAPSEVLGVPLRHYVRHNWLHYPLLLAVQAFFLWAATHRDTLFEWGRRLQYAPADTHRRLAWGMGATGALFLSALKLWQHYALYTNAYDLAEYANVMWNTWHGHLFYDGMQHRSYLGDHMSPIFVTFGFLVEMSAAPLLVLQCVGIGLSATAVYLLCWQRLQQKWMAPVFALLLLLNPYLNEVSRYDFHSAALALPIFLWLLYFLDGDRFRPVLVLAVLAMLTEETLVPLVAGIGVYIALVHGQRRSWGWLLFAAAVIFCGVTLKVWTPQFLHSDQPTHIGRYTNLGGDTLNAIILNVVLHPWIVLREWLLPLHKTMALASLLACVGFLPLLAPRQALLAVPPLLLVGCSWHPPQAAYLCQYSALVLPFLFLAAVHGVARLPKMGTAAATLLMNAVFLFNVWHMPPYMDDWSRAHVRAVYQLMAQIPPQASVSATQRLLPHLCTRHQIDLVGDDMHGREFWREDDYLLLEAVTGEPQDTTPLAPERYREVVSEVRASPQYVVVDERDGAVLLRHINRNGGTENGNSR